MNILRKLTKKDLSLNKKRTIGTIIGIILSTALITCVGGMFYVFQNTMVQNAINADGYWHIQLSDISEKEVQEVSLNKDFNNMIVVKDLGYSITNIDDDDYVKGHIYSMDKDTFDYLGYKTLEGTFPQNEKEIIISKTYAKFTNINIGDTITLNIGDMVDGDGNKINYEYYDKAYITNSKEYTFKVVGLLNAHPTMITTNIDSYKNDVYLTLKNPKNYKQDFEELLSSGKFNDTRKNNDLLRWEVFSFSDNTLSFLMKVVGIVIFIILITSVFSIRNSFAISTTEKIKMYGMLKSIGTTTKQVKKMVLFEGFYLGLIGIPFGCLLGLGVTYLLTIIVNAIASSGSLTNSESLLYYKFSLIPSLIALIVGIIMIYLSTLGSKRKASKISPIQNIRNAGSINNKKNLKVPKIISKIFKVGGTLSYKNVKRSSKKYRVTVISLTISIFVFILVSCFLNYGIKTLNDEYISLNYNLSISVPTGNADVEKYKSLAKAHIRYVVDYDKQGLFYSKDTSKIIEKRSIVNDCSRYDKINSDNCIGESIPMANLDLIIYDADSFKDLAKILHLNYDNIKSKGILINTSKEQIGKKTKYITLSTYKKGDTIHFDNLFNDYKLDYEIAEITDYRPWGMETYFGGYLPYLIISEEFYPYKDSLIAEYIYFETDNAEKLEDEIKKINNDAYIMNVDAEIKQMQSTILIFSIFIYGFIIVVTLIGITSVFNTITSNMELRRKDFAILKSIGMTRKEFNNMILLESIFYSSKSLFYGTILGLIGSYLVYKVFAGRIDFGYLFPTKAIIISILFIIIIVYTIMEYSIKKINKQNIIETIRNDNV